MIDEFAKQYLLDDLRLVRLVLVSKLDGLSESYVRRPLTYTGTNLLGLIKHLAISEAWYFGDVFERPFPGKWRRWGEGRHLDAMWATADESRTEIVDATAKPGNTPTQPSLHSTLTHPDTCPGGHDRT